MCAGSGEPLTSSERTLLDDLATQVGPAFSNVRLTEDLRASRQRIVAEAATLFNQRGFEGGSMADLMEATGLEKGGIYRHFSTK